MRLGENSRAMRIGEEYGKRLNEIGENLREKVLGKLLASYPSHNFVIDGRETKRLFKRVREPKDKEIDLINVLDCLARDPQATCCIRFLSEQIAKGGKDVPEREPEPGSDGATKETSKPTGNKGKKLAAVERKG